MSIQRELDGRVLRLRLDRPEKRNALTGALCSALVESLSMGEADDAVGAILLEGSGGFFCAGMDLTEALDPTTDTAIHEQLFTAGERLHKPLVCAVQGGALGGGVGLLANAHIVYAAEDAQFALPEIRIALWPFVIYHSLTRALGSRRTLELSLSGRSFSAAEALQYGLVQQLVPAEQVLAQALEEAQRLASYSPAAMRRGLTFVQRTRGLAAAEANQIALAMRQDGFNSAEFQAAAARFRES